MKRKKLTLSALFCVLMSSPGWGQQVPFVTCTAHAVNGGVSSVSMPNNISAGTLVNNPVTGDVTMKHPIPPVPFAASMNRSVTGGAIIGNYIADVTSARSGRTATDVSGAAGKTATGNRYAARMLFKAVEPQQLFEEHFDKFTAGTNDAPDGENMSGGSLTNYRIKEGMMSVEGWTGFHVYQAGGACALRAYESYGSTYYGHLSTPEAALYGEATITLRARRLPGSADAGRIVISLCDNTSGVEDYRSFDLTSEWQEITYTSDKGTFNDKNIFQIEAKDGEILLDDIVVTRKRTKIAAPYANPAINLNLSSFKASWEPVEGVSEYLLNVYYKDMPEVVIPEGTLTEGFDNINLKADGNIDTANPNYPEGWTIDVSSAGSKDVLTTTGNFASGKLALNFDAVGDYVISPKTPAPIKKIDFWVKPSTMESDPDYNYSLLGVYVQRENGEWEHIANLPNYWMQEKGGIYSFDSEVLGEYVTRVKFEAVNMGNCTFAVDDVALTYETQPVPYMMIEDLSLTETSKLVENIDPEKEYFYYVKAKDGDIVSKPSQTIWVDGIVGIEPEALPATDVTATSFTANWKPLPHAESYIVNLYEDITTKQANEKVTLLHEDFNRIEQGTVDNPASPMYYTPSMSLAKEGMADADWTVLYPIWAKGMIGGKAVNEWSGAYGLVVSPLLPVKGGQNLEVEVTAVSTVASDTLYVVIMESPTSTQAVMGYQIPFNEQQGSVTSTVVFEGKYLDMLEDDRLYHLGFGSQKGQNVFIDEVTVRQLRTNAGEEVRVPARLVYPDTHSHTFASLNPSGRYAYDVRAYRKKDFVEYTSEYSEVIPVTLATSVRDLTLPVLSVKATAEGVGISLEAAARVEIYDIAGRKVYSHRLAQGSHSVSLPPALYMVKAGHQAVKVMVP